MNKVRTPRCCNQWCTALAVKYGLWYKRKKGQESVRVILRCEAKGMLADARPQASPLSMETPRTTTV